MSTVVTCEMSSDLHQNYTNADKHNLTKLKHAPFVFKTLSDDSQSRRGLSERTSVLTSSPNAN